MMDDMTLEDSIKEQAHALGFELAGIAPATEADGFDRLRDWLAHAFAGEMDYMQRHADARRHPSSILPKVRSVVMVGMNYHPGVRSQESGVTREGGGPSLTPGKIASYARGSA